jgi:Uma2 family endonuclease
MRTPPDMAVEILSKDQSRRDMLPKVGIYRGSGVPVVWLVDPERTSVDVYEHDIRRTLSSDDALTCSLIPELHLPLVDLFEHRRSRG